MNGYEIALVVAVAIATAFLGAMSLTGKLRLSNVEWVVAIMPLLVSWLLVTPVLAILDVESSVIIVSPLLISLVWAIGSSLYFSYVKPAAQPGNSLEGG